MASYLSTVEEIRAWMVFEMRLGARYFELWEREVLQAPVKRCRCLVLEPQQALRVARRFMQQTEDVSGRAVMAVFGFGLQSDVTCLARAFVVSRLSEFGACAPKLGPVVIGSLVSVWLPSLGTSISNLEIDRFRRDHQQLKALRNLWQREWSKA